MAAEWVYISDPASGHQYYANVLSGVTQWEPPKASTLVPGQALEEPSKAYTKLSNGWVKHTDEETGRPYFFNKASQETQWDMPSTAERNTAGAEASQSGSVEDVSSDEDLPPPLPGQLTKMTLDPAEQEQKKQKRNANRLKILAEVLASEKKYVEGLQTLEKVYMVPLRTVADSCKGAIFAHKDLDAVFLNMDVICKVNTKFLEDLQAELKSKEESWPDVHFGPIISKAAKNFKGCYTRYVNNYDAAEQHLNKLKKSDKEKHRYLEVCKSHPDAGGLDVRAFLIQPVQRVPRYRMLLEDLLAHTDPGHTDEEPLKEALEKVREVAMHINEEKRHIEEVEKLRQLLPRFSSGSAMEKELVRYDRRFIKEGEMIKVRLTHRQRRHIFLFNDLLIYAVGSAKGLVVKGRIGLEGTRVERLPDTEKEQNAFALVDRNGKGYTWVGDDAGHSHEWFEAIKEAIQGNRKGDIRESQQLLAGVSTKPVQQRVEAVKSGTVLMKYNLRDGKSNPRWVRVTPDGQKIGWGDPGKKECKSEMKLTEAVSLQHGAKSSAFFKQQGAKKDLDWLCFSVVFKGRTIDFAATNAEALLDWYLALATMIPQSAVTLLDEDELRQQIEQMI